MFVSTRRPGRTFKLTDRPLAGTLTLQDGYRTIRRHVLAREENSHFQLVSDLCCQPTDICGVHLHSKKYWIYPCQHGPSKCQDVL